jgi:zinc/manganese transport system substrate-binding protein
VVTTSLWADVVEHVVGDDATVETIVPVGADAHAYAPSSRQVAAIQTADLVIANGLGLEEGLGDVLDAAAEDGVRVVELAPDLDPIPFSFVGADDHHDDDGSHAEEDGDEEGHDHEGDDPHVWMDPDRVALAALLVADALGELDPSIDWTARAEAFADELRTAGTTMDDALAAVAADRRKLVTNHDALGYFADRFDFEIVGVVIPGGSTLADPSSGELAELVEVMETEGVRVIFGETSSPTNLADAVAAELGDDVEVVELYTGSLGEPGSGADTVIGMLITNAQRIAGALAPPS